MFGKSKIEVLQKKSESIISIFSSTKKELEKVTTEIIVEKANINQHISKLQIQMQELEETQKVNESVCTKLEQFLT